MPMLEMGVRALSSRMPKVISPKAHAIIDYAVAGTFFLGGALMWHSHKRASIASFLCGAAEAAVSMLTDYPGGVARVIDFDTHGKIDAGMSGVVASMPAVLGFSDDKKAFFFRGQGIGIAVTTAMTAFEATRGHRRRRAA